MDPSKPPRLTRPTMNGSETELKEEITKNLRFLQRQMEVHYGHRTNRSESTLRFLAKVVGLTRQLNEQWMKYIGLDSTIKEEFPERPPHNPQQEAERRGNARRQDNSTRQPKNVNKPASKVEEQKRLPHFKKKNRPAVPNMGTRPKEVSRHPIPTQTTDPWDDPHMWDSWNDTLPSGASWSDRTTTTIFDRDVEFFGGIARPRQMNRQAQQASASYIQEPSTRKKKPPPVVYDGSCDQRSTRR